MSGVWFWLVILVAIFFGTVAVITYVQSGGASEFAREMALSISEKKKEDSGDGGDAKEEEAEAA